MKSQEPNSNGDRLLLLKEVADELHLTEKAVRHLGMPDNSRPITCTTHIRDIGAMRAVLNATDTAYYLHFTEGTVLKLVKLGQIPYRMLDGQCLFLIKEIDAWFDG